MNFLIENEKYFSEFEINLIDNLYLISEQSKDLNLKLYISEKEEIEKTILSLQKITDLRVYTIKNGRKKVTRILSSFTYKDKEGVFYISLNNLKDNFKYVFQKDIFLENHC